MGLATLFSFHGMPVATLTMRLSLRSSTVWVAILKVVVEASSIRKMSQGLFQERPDL